MTDLARDKLKDPSLYEPGKSYIDGKWVTAKNGKTFDVVDPFTRKIIGTCPEMGKEDVDEACLAAYNAFPAFSRKTGRERAKMLRNFDAAFQSHRADLVHLLIKEIGKTKAEAEAEITYASSFFDWFAGEAERMYGDVIPAANPAMRIHTMKQAVGPVAAMCPWNLPLAMLARKVGAALAAGCTVVAKPAGESPLSTLAMAEIATRSGYPRGVFSVVTCLDRTAEVGEALCRNEHIRKVTFTGSTRVGKLLARYCADGLKKVSMECGGNAATIVFDSCDIEKAVTSVITSKTRNAGQTCVAANRIFVQAGIHDEFVKRFIEKLATMKQGDGYAAGTMMGPLIHERAVDKARLHVQDALQKGAKLEYGPAKAPPLRPDEGFFYPPTVLTNLQSDMLISHEETFAPVAAIRKFNTEEEVIKEANNSAVGLGAYVFTTDLRVATRMSEALESGMVGINTGILSASEGAFGGIKESGYGREGSKFGLDDYTTLKSVTTDVS